MKSIILKSLTVALLVQSSALAWGLDNATVSSVAQKTKATRYIPTEPNIRSAREIAVNVVADSSAVPVAVSIASYMGTTASTGTAIAALSGAAATSATLASIGSTAVGTAIGGAAAVAGVAVSPVLVGGVIVAGVATGIAYGINSIIDTF